jgi:hypothetical protein
MGQRIRGQRTHLGMYLEETFHRWPEEMVRFLRACTYVGALKPEGHCCYDVCGAVIHVDLTGGTRVKFFCRCPNYRPSKCRHIQIVDTKCRRYTCLQTLRFNKKTVFEAFQIGSEFCSGFEFWFIKNFALRSIFVYILSFVFSSIFNNFLRKYILEFLSFSSKFLGETRYFQKICSQGPLLRSAIFTFFGFGGKTAFFLKTN